MQQQSDKPNKRKTQPRQFKVQKNLGNAKEPKLGNHSSETVIDPVKGSLQVYPPSHNHAGAIAKERKAHKKHQHDHFKEDLEKAIAHFESSKESYANTLLYPEVCMARIPFICPVPTALARGTAVYTLTPDNSVGDTFGWVYVPEAISTPSVPDSASYHAPFYYTTADSAADTIILNQRITRDELFPGIQFDSIDCMRVVGSSLTVTQTQRLVDRAGYGMMSRVYGLGNSANY